MWYGVGIADSGELLAALRWTAKSLRALAGELGRQGHRAGPDTVAGLLHAEGFSLQGNAKVTEGNQVPDRDAQFRYLNEQVREHRDAGEPVIGVDAKKTPRSSRSSRSAAGGTTRAAPPARTPGGC